MPPRSFSASFAYVENCFLVTSPDASKKLARLSSVASLARTASASWLTCSFARSMNAACRPASSLFCTNQKTPNASANDAVRGTATDRHRLRQMSLGSPSAIIPIVPKSHTPRVSPTHQVVQFIGTAWAGRFPASQRVQMPHVGDTSDAAGPARPMNAKISLFRINAAGHPA